MTMERPDHSKLPNATISGPPDSHMPISQSTENSKKYMSQCDAQDKRLIIIIMRMDLRL